MEASHCRKGSVAGAHGRHQRRPNNSGRRWSGAAPATRACSGWTRLGLISKDDSELITNTLTEPQTPVDDLQIPAAEITSVQAEADLDTILATATEHDRSRLLVRDGPLVVGSVHARDALIARGRGRTVTARELARPVPELAARDTVGHAIEQLRRRRATLAVVCDDSGRLTGMVTLDDLLARLLHPQQA